MTAWYDTLEWIEATEHDNAEAACRIGDVAVAADRRLLAEQIRAMVDPEPHDYGSHADGRDDALHDVLELIEADR